MTTAPDLRQHPRWAPLTGTLNVPGWAVHLWMEPRLPGEVTQDATLVTVIGDTLRLAVTDGVCNVLADDAEARTQRAIHTVRGHVAATVDTERALSGANRELCDPLLRPRHRNPLAAVAVADIPLWGGPVHAWRAADCEVWVRHAGAWRSLFSAQILTAEALAVRQAHATGAFDAARGMAAQERLIDDPDCWRTHCLGLAPAARLERHTVADVDEIIVATDGARLTAERCADLPQWLRAGLQTPDPHAPAGHVSPHGDVTVVHARRS